MQLFQHSNDINKFDVDCIFEVFGKEKKIESFN